MTESAALPTGQAGLEHATVLYLTTIGRRTGQKRRVELWFAYRDHACYLLSGAREDGRGANWFRNGLAHPQVEVEAAGARWQGTFEKLNDEEAQNILALFRDKYGEETVKRWYRDSRRLPVKIILQT